MNAKHFVLIGAACFAACNNAGVQKADTHEPAQAVIVGDRSAALPPIRRQFSCLPESAAIVAAHRGTSKKADLAENSGGSLKALMDHGIFVAEVDVTGLNDGTHILFHDGVWDEKSTGKGPVAASAWTDVSEYLLLDTEGDFSADRPIKLSEALALIKNKMYLEVDFKSSADYATVIDMIRDAGMAQQVILIAYNESQARKLASLAPEMMMSVGIREASDIATLERAGVKRENMAAWLGRGPYDPGLLSVLKKAGIPVLAWPNRSDEAATEGPAALMVTDYALKTQPIRGLREDDKRAYELCLITD